MLRSRSAAGLARCRDLLVRVHVLPGGWGGRAGRPVSQLRRGAPDAAPPPRGEAGQVSCVHEAHPQARRLRAPLCVSAARGSVHATRKRGRTPWTRLSNALSTPIRRCRPDVRPGRSARCGSSPSATRPSAPAPAAPSPPGGRTRAAPPPTGSSATAPQASGALAPGGGAVGALAVGAVALGALAVGRLIIGRLWVRHARIHDLEIRDLKVARLLVSELRIEKSDYAAGRGARGRSYPTGQ